MITAKIKSPGNVNAAHCAFIKDKTGKTIGTCMDTPNNAAYAFSINKNAHLISTPFNGDWTREHLKGHFIGLDESIHAKYVNYYPVS